MRFQKTDKTIQPRPKRQLYNTQENEDYTKLLHFHISLSAACSYVCMYVCMYVNGLVTDTKIQ